MRHRQTVLLRFTHSVLAHCTSWEKCGILQSTLWRSRTRTVSAQRSSTSRKGGLSPLKHCLSCSGGAAGPRPSAVAMFDANIRRAASARQWGITTRPAGAGWDSPGALLDGCPVDLPEVADSDHQLVLRLQTNEHVLAYSRSRDYPQGVAAVGRDLPRSVQALTSGSCQIPRDPKRSHGDNIEHGGNVEQTRRERDASEMPGIRRCQTQTQTHRVSGRVPGRERECQAEERERPAPTAAAGIINRDCSCKAHENGLLPQVSSGAKRCEYVTWSMIAPFSCCNCTAAAAGGGRVRCFRRWDHTRRR